MPICLRFIVGVIPLVFIVLHLVTLTLYIERERERERERQTDRILV
jgi:hypothetical protein